MRIKVLVVEDKEALNISLINMLKKEGYAAYGESKIVAAQKKFLEVQPHIILLDIMLPNGNGYDLIPYFKKHCIEKHFDSRVLMMTALDDIKSKSFSYENGADDYITKPFDLYELVYKLNAMRKRIFSQLIEFHIGDITFNIDTNKLSCNKKTYAIQPSQIKLLKELSIKYNENAYLDKGDFSAFFNEEVNEDFRMQTLVARLRKNLKAIGSNDVIIETIYGKGYRLVVCGRG